MPIFRLYSLQQTLVNLEAFFPRFSQFLCKPCQLYIFCIEGCGRPQNTNTVGGAIMAKPATLPFIVFFLLIAGLSHAGVPGFMKHRMGTLEGQIYFEGKAVANATVAFFEESKGLPPILGKMGGRIPESLGRTDGEGKFKVKLIQGQYYLGILLRNNPDILGPPRDNEVYYFATDDQGRLRKVAIEDFKEIDAGRIDSALPDTFPEKEDYFTVEGTVYREEGGEPLADAIVLAKTTPTMRRPQYFSERTGQDGKFQIKLPPGRTFYLVTRTDITGTKPEAGENIGKYGADTFSETSTSVEQMIGGPPPGVAKKETPRIVADSIPVSGNKGDLVSGLKIVMYKMPDQNELRQENMRLAEAPDYETGFAISNLFFAYNSSELDEQAFAELDLWVDFFQGRRDLAITLIGHADSKGSQEYNLNLSRRRAETVANYLVNKGIAPARITVEGAGSAKPIADNATEEGRSKNRRVDIKFDK